MDYLLLSKRFTIGRTWRQDNYPGAAIAGREGFYLIFGHVSKLVEAVAFATSTPFESNPIPRDEKSRNCPAVWRGPYHELAASVTTHPDWPRLEKPDETWFLGREVIDKVTLSIWTGVTIQIGEARYSIPVGMFSAGRVRKSLLSLGWLE